MHNCKQRSFCNMLIWRWMQKHIQHNKDERTQFFRKKYTSHFIRKVLCVRGELETEQNCNILTPQPFWLQQYFFPVLLGCSTGGLGVPLLGHGSHSNIFSPTDWLPVEPGLYNYLTSTCFLWRHNSHSIQPVDSQGYPPISSTGCTCYLHGRISHLTAWPGRRSICYILFNRKNNLIRYNPV